MFLLLLVVVVVVVKFVGQNSLHISETLHLTNKQTNIKPLCTNDWRKWKCLKTSPVPYGRCPTEERRPKWYIYIYGFLFSKVNILCFGFVGSCFGSILVTAM